VDRQWDDFMQPATAGQQAGANRLTNTRGTRSDLYRVAIDGFEAHPLQGDGAGSFRQRWLRRRDVDESVQNAHSLELETLGETGAVGALLLLAFLSALITAAIRARVRPGGLPRAQVAAVGGAAAVWLVHSFVDWDWQQPALTGVVLVLCTTLLPYGRTRVRRRKSPASAL
jgi:O-antigen ligase